MNISIKTYVNVLFLMFVSTAPSFADLIDWVDYKHQQRCTRFNTQANADNKICVNTIFQTKSIILGEHTDVINGVLSDQKRVSRTRHADDTKGERKRILQAVMATALIHTNDVRFLLPDHGLSVTDYVYKHFEILRLTELFSKHLLMHTHSTPLDQFANLYAYSGLEHAVLCDWFNEMRETHAPGIAQRNESASRAAITRTGKYSSMESKTSVTSSSSYEKSMTNEPDRNGSSDVKETVKEKVHMHNKSTDTVVKESEPCLVMHDYYALQVLFEIAAKQQDALLLQRCVLYNKGFCLTSKDIDDALFVAVRKGSLPMVRVLMAEREECNVTQAGLDSALGQICRTSVMNSYEIVKVLLSPHSSIKPTQNGIDIAVSMTCNYMDIPIIQLLFEQSAWTKPTEQGLDNALLRLAKKHESYDYQKNAPAFLAVFLSPHASVCPTQEGIERAFRAASDANILLSIHNDSCQVRLRLSKP